LLASVVRIALATLFVVAGGGKLLTRDDFAATLRGWQIIPASAEKTLAATVPVLELLLVRPGFGAAMAAALLITFTMAGGAARLRGGEPRCACLFPGRGAAELNRWHVLRNAALVGGCIAVLATGSDPGVGSLSAVIAGASIALALLLMEGASDLFNSDVVLRS
jgi:uncharacterized membrane protein YphA (DoxX/SURF4 family)